MAPEEQWNETAFWCPIDEAMEGIRKAEIRGVGIWNNHGNALRHLKMAAEFATLTSSLRLDSWEWEDERGQWHAYPDVVQAELRAHGTHEHTHNGQHYLVVLAAMQQTNTQTGVPPRVRTRSTFSWR